MTSGPGCQPKEEAAGPNREVVGRFGDHDDVEANPTDPRLTALVHLDSPAARVLLPCSRVGQKGTRGLRNDQRREEGGDSVASYCFSASV